MAYDGRVVILIDADTKGYDKSFAEMRTTAKNSAGQVKNDLQTAASGLSSFGSKATKAITLPLAAAATASVLAATKIDTSLTNVRKTVDGTEEQYQSLKQAAVDFSKVNAVSADQILDIQSLGAQLGYSIDELQMFGEVVSGLDIATNMDAETAGTQLAQFANITKMAHSESENFASTIVALGNTSATTEADISNMAMRIAAAGTQVGMSQADILGLAASLASMGVEAEAGGTAVSTIMSQIDKDIATGSKDVKEWANAAGMSATDFANAWKSDPVGALSALLSGMENATKEGGNMSVMLENLGIDSIRQTDIMKRMAGNSELVGKTVKNANEAWKDNKALSAEVANRNESLAAKFEMLKNKGIAMLDQFGKPVADALLDIADAADPVLSSVADLAKQFSEADKGTQQMILGFAAAAAAIGPLSTGASKLIKFYDKMSTTVTKVTAGNKNLATSQNIVNSTMRAGQITARGLSAVMKTIAPIAVLSVGIELFTKFSEIIETNKKYTDDLTSATEGLRGSMDSFKEVDMTSTLEETGDAAETTAKKFSEVVAAQAEFAKQSEQTWGDINGKAAAVQGFADTIGELANKSLDSAEDQARLAAAVAGYNEITGSSVQILDITNGKLSESTDKILANAEAWKRNAEAQALQQELVSLYTLLHDAQAATAEATKSAAQAQADYDEAVLNGYPDIASYKAVLDNANQGLNDAIDAEIACKDAIDKRSQSLVDVTTDQQSAAASIRDFIQNNNDLKDSLDGVDIDGFSASLLQLGFDTATLNTIGSENIKELAKNFNGSTEDLINACANAGVDIPNKLSDGIYKGSGGVYVAADSMAAGVLTKLTGKDYSSAGGFVSQGVAQGIKDDLSAALAAAGMSEEVIAAINEALGIASPSKRAAESGEQVPAGLANGIDSKTSKATDSADKLGDKAIDALKQALEPAQKTGESAGGNFASGVGSNAEDSWRSGISLKDKALEGLSALLDKATQTGAESSENFASGVGSNDGLAEAKARLNANAAKKGFKANDKYANTWGNHLVRQFASGIRGAIDFVSGAANTIANTVRNILGHSVPKEGILREGGQGEAIWGKHLVQNLASGMVKGLSDLQAASDDVAEALYRSLSDLDAPAIKLDVQVDADKSALESSLSRIEQIQGILDSVSIASVIGGDLGLQGLLAKINITNKKLDETNSKLDTINESLRAMCKILGLPVDMMLNDREFGRMVRKVG